MKTEKQYIHAFNNGYILAQHEPVFLNTITQNVSSGNNYLQGLFAGKKQHDFEINKDRLLELQQLRSRSQNKERDFEK